MIFNEILHSSPRTASYVENAADSEDSHEGRDVIQCDMMLITGDHVHAIVQTCRCFLVPHQSSCCFVCAHLAPPKTGQLSHGEPAILLMAPTALNSFCHRARKWASTAATSNQAIGTSCPH